MISIWWSFKRVGMFSTCTYQISLAWLCMFLSNKFLFQSRLSPLTCLVTGKAHGPSRLLNIELFFYPFVFHHLLSIIYFSLLKTTFPCHDHTFFTSLPVFVYTLRMVRILPYLSSSNEWPTSFFSPVPHDLSRSRLGFGMSRFWVQCLSEQE